MLGILLEIFFTATIAAGVWIVAGSGAALIVAGAIGLVLVELYGLELVEGDEETGE